MSTPVVVTHPCDLFREGLRQTLRRSRFRPLLFSIANADVERCAQSAEEWVWLFGVHKFELTDEQLVRQVATSNRAVRIVILAASQVASDILRALNAGACGFLCQDISKDQLLKSLELIVGGQTVIYPQIWNTASEDDGTKPDCGITSDVNGTSSSPPHSGSNAAATRITRQNPSREGLAAAKGLSSRELLVLRTLMGGASNKVIARTLVITESTVKVHMKAILRKLRLQNRTQAAIWACNYLSEPVSRRL
jgi:two-component system nitrate/nitrite response regulator NarL